MSNIPDATDTVDPAAIPERQHDAILAQWKELHRLLNEALESPGLEAIHDLRVASRRFRAALQLFQPWVAPKKAAQMKKQIRKLTRVLGCLRNLDEALIFFQGHTPSAPSSGYRIVRILSEQRPEALARVKKCLSSFDQHRFDRIVRDAASGIKKRQTVNGITITLPDYFSDTSQRLFQPIHDLLPAATSREGRDSRHALRIAIKKWRYFFETVAPVLGRDYSSILGQLKEYQTILGRMNDVVVFGALCNTLPLTRHELAFAETLLGGEDERLLRKLAELIERKPLVYYPIKSI
jgi:CHAD domain-containing protein